VAKPERSSSKAEIRKSDGSSLKAGEAASAAALHQELQVDLAPVAGWTRRNPVTEIFLPSLFKSREGKSLRPKWQTFSHGEVAVTWIGHASFLLQSAAGNVLIDPIWAKWVKGIKRMRHPGVELGALPPTDLVLVTHAHFDHLDRRTLRRVATGQPIVVPFEVGDLVHDLGFGVVQELHYWESFELDGIRVTLTPCKHWGARMLHDSHRGFGGFIVEMGGKTVYHGGDSAAFDGFAEIGRRFAIDVALLPIGAYEPPSLRSVHMNPEEALDAFVSLNAKVMVPMHHGTFRMSYEPLDEPPCRLLAAARSRGLEDRIAFLTEGAPVVF
jgi:L-ascorbate metabolism protein UlaG (beta-lactamase superfamily)